MRLYVDGHDCPIGALQSLPIGFSIEGMTDPQSAMQGQELELEIPSTAEANEIFGKVRDIHAAKRFNDAHHQASLCYKGVELFSGTIYVVGLSLKEYPRS